MKLNYNTLLKVLIIFCFSTFLSYSCKTRKKSSKTGDKANIYPEFRPYKEDPLISRPRLYQDQISLKNNKYLTRIKRWHDDQQKVFR